MDAPGRVNLIGEHIDYHNLPVLPMAIQRRVSVKYRSREDRIVSARSEGFDAREFELGSDLAPSPAGDWINYVKAAARATIIRWNLRRGADLEIASDLPPAAGLSSSSALLVGATLALLRSNGMKPTFPELMEILPDGEQFVGTRGGGMDHAAVLASRAGCALAVRFAPVSVQHVPLPSRWSFLVAHSLVTAEKSGTVREQYNTRRLAGSRALASLGLTSYRSAEPEMEGQLEGDERLVFRHVVSEGRRVEQAMEAMRANDAQGFGELLNASHESLKNQLRVSCPALDELVDLARAAGAIGARLTGAGFGGCAVIFCMNSDRDRIAESLVTRFYGVRSGFDPKKHLIFAEPSAGALQECSKAG